MLSTAGRAEVCLTPTAVYLIVPVRLQLM